MNTQADRVSEILGRVRLGGPLANLVLYAYPSGQTVVVRMEAQVNDRDDGGSTFLTYKFVADNDDIDAAEDGQILEFIYRIVLAYLHHELDENFYFGGSRVKDPHIGQSGADMSFSMPLVRLMGKLHGPATSERARSS